MGADGRGFAETKVRLYRVGRVRPRNIKVALGRGGRARFHDGGHGALEGPKGELRLGLIAAKLRVAGLVPLVDVLAGRWLRLWRPDGAGLFVGGVDGRVGHGGEVAGAVAKLILDGEGRQPTQAATGLVLVLEALRQ